MIPQSSPRQTHGNCVSPSPLLPPSGVDDGREEAPTRSVPLTRSGSGGLVINISVNGWPDAVNAATAERWGVSLAQAERVCALFLRNEIKRALKRRAHPVPL